ncbi:GGDEF domain-containing protein [Edaphobacter bradus]|uniref:GGDEF domain-containing protein n=1 Tax=Edaphobacter bradus TaxID=2259016 RepID=UPI0021E01F70|nr:GGDEF domain-containing protein [Edaphobacter bradus]
MLLVSWFDNRTLFSCQFILAAVFAVLFISMRRTYPAFRGIGSVAASFLLGVPGVLLLYMSGVIPDLLSTTVPGLLILASFTLFYRGLLRFLGDDQPITPLLIADTVALAFICFYGQVRHNIVPCLAAVSFTVALTRGLTAFKLLQHAQARTHMRLFGLTMALFTLNSICRAFFIAWHGASANYTQRSVLQSLPLAVNLLYICLTGLFFKSMISNRILTIVRTESEQDPLTGALNRRGIELRLNVEIKRIARSGGHLSIALIDVDHFKIINDTLGHAAGDAAIQLVAKAISSRLRAYDSLGRYGGDEFLLVLPQTTSLDATSVLDRITEATRSLHWPGNDLPLTLSIGVTEAIPGEPIAAALIRADKALYDAKHAGRDCSRLLLHESQDEPLNLESELSVS